MSPWRRCATCASAFDGVRSRPAKYRGVRADGQHVLVCSAACRDEYEVHVIERRLVHREVVAWLLVGGWRRTVGAA